MDDLFDGILEEGHPSGVSGVADEWPVSSSLDVFQSDSLMESLLQDVASSPLILSSGDNLFDSFSFPTHSHLSVCSNASGQGLSESDLSESNASFFTHSTAPSPSSSLSSTISSVDSSNSTEGLSTRANSKYNLRNRAKRKPTIVEEPEEASRSKPSQSNARITSQPIKSSSPDSNRSGSSGKGKTCSKSKPPPLSKYRRRTANARERNRMQEINSAFELLRQAVPPLYAEATTGGNGNGNPTGAGPGVGTGAAHANHHHNQHSDHHHHHHCKSHHKCCHSKGQKGHSCCSKCRCKHHTAHHHHHHHHQQQQQYNKQLDAEDPQNKLSKIHTLRLACSYIAALTKLIEENPL